MRSLIMIAVTALCVSAANAQNITDLSVSANTAGADRDLCDSNIVPDSVFIHPERIRYDNRCFQIEGCDTYIYSGSMHYFRIPRPLWRDRMQKVKAAGFNCVETYVPWNWHERSMPSSVEDFSHVDMTELKAFLELATSMGFYVILRPGPYICAEWTGGGFPQWLMQKRPKKARRNVWMQSDDEYFMSWSRHWYRAVCRVASPYQITRRKPSTGGIILYQIENEFNRVSWFPKEAKLRYLEFLADVSRQEGIDVPLITCWTSESRNVMHGSLNGVVDMVNSYPKWNVSKRFGGQINPQLDSQPGKPLMAGELQGGWCCELGWKFFNKQDGLAPVQTTNITLYALQRGFSALNYYMLVGGTNFDDFAARQQVTSYDYAAAIGEDGSVNERYERMKALADFIHVHGTRIARARLIPSDALVADSAVELALRVHDNGDRYYFVRTEDRSKSHSGYLNIDGVRTGFTLEPFGAMVYLLKAGSNDGEWFPNQAKACSVKARAEMPKLKTAGTFQDVLPKQWKPLRYGQHIDDDGIYGYHHVYYRTQGYAGCMLKVQRTAKGTVNRSNGDTLVVAVDGKLLPIAYQDNDNASYLIPGDSLSGEKIDVYMLLDNKGLHHHVNASVEQHWKTGPSEIVSRNETMPLAYAYTEKDRGTALSSGRKRPSGTPAPLLTWHVYSFDFKLQDNAGCHLHLEQQGNGFIYVNGHCIGRCWQQGPQREYFIPGCWLKKKNNTLAISLLPVDGKAEVKTARLE